jgi:hypothetical protein
MAPDDDDDPADDWTPWENRETVIDALPDLTPTNPVETLPGYDAGRAAGRKDGAYEVIHDLRAILTAGKNAPEFIETVSLMLTRRAGLPWPPPDRGR